MAVLLHEFITNPSLSLSHLIDLLLVQVKNLSRGGGSNLLINPVARLRAVPTIPRQYKHHLGEKRGQESGGDYSFIHFHFAGKGN